MNLFKYSFFLIFISLSVQSLLAQDLTQGSKITGNFQFESQYYNKDSLIGAATVPEKIGSDAYLYLNYSLGNFTAGLRYESYMNPLQGIDPKFKGNGIANRFVGFNSEMLDVVAGNFYEQFGSGVILRTYEERLLGIDNSIDGIRVRFRPINGIDITGLIGKQRYFWSESDGMIRGGDINLDINSLLPNLLTSDYLTIGASVVSKYQVDQQTKYVLPQNVLAYSTRAALSGSNYNVDAEYAYKYNDPNTTNNFSYNPGTALRVNASYFQPGFGLSLGFHRIDNMDFRSDRAASGTNLTLNYLPPLTMQQDFRLATIYPYATQLNGEIGFQGEITINLAKGSTFGGEYGTTLILNYSRINGLDTSRIDDFTYNSPFLKFGSRLYFQEGTIQIRKKLSDRVEGQLALINTLYDKDIITHQGSPLWGKVHSTVLAAEMTYKFTPKQSLRCQVQNSWTLFDSTLSAPDPTVINGNWALVLFEYTVAPSWYISAWDEYNYGNYFPELRLHFMSGSVAYVFGQSRIALGYGRQRGGILCVGGVCRTVPAADGMSLSITSSF